MKKSNIEVMAVVQHDDGVIESAHEADLPPEFWAVYLKDGDDELQELDLSPTLESAMVMAFSHVRHRDAAPGVAYTVPGSGRRVVLHSHEDLTRLDIPHRGWWW